MMMQNTRAKIKEIRGFPPHFQRKFGFRDDIPTFMGIHLKPICNFRCRKCFIGDQKKLKETQNLLSLEEMERIIESAANYGVLSLQLSGAGEPLLDPRIYKVIELAQKSLYNITVVTNQSILNKENVSFFRDNKVTLCLSIDTTDAASFSKQTRTSEDMFHKVKKNMLMAQKVYKDTKKVKKVDASELEVYRIFVHMTVLKGAESEIDRVKELTFSDTLFSVSPVADAGYARENRGIIANEKINQELSEKHIVLCQDIQTQANICGFFRYGIDINFDGQLLLDAHAIETRKGFRNIRDFDYDIKKAWDYLKPIKTDFISNYMDGFCPVRSKRFDDWLNDRTAPASVVGNPAAAG